MGIYLSKRIKEVIVGDIIYIFLRNHKLVFSLLCSGIIIRKLLVDKMANLPPGPLNLPYINAGWKLLFNQRAATSLIKLNENFKSDIVSCRYFSSPNIIVINSVELIKELFKKNATNFSDRDSLQRMQGSLSGEEFADAIFSINYGEKFLQIKRLILRSFYHDNYSMLRHTLDFECDELVSNLSEYDGKPVFDLKKLVSRHLAKIICSFTILSNSSMNEEDLEEFIRITGEFNDRITAVGTFIPNSYPWLWRKLIFRSTDAKFRECVREYRVFLKKFIELHEKTPEEERGSNLTFRLLSYKNMEMGNELIDTILMMTVDNPTSICEACMWLFLYLANYPDVQAKARRLIVELINKKRKLTPEDRPKLPYITALIYEVFRCCNLQPLSPVHHVTENFKIRNYDIPKGSIVLSNYTAMNSDPKNFPNPNRFDPERFLDKHGDFKHADTLTPWGFGPRSCPGERLAKMELFLIIVRVLEKFEITFQDGFVPDLTPIFDSFSVSQPFVVRFIPLGTK